MKEFIVRSSDWGIEFIGTDEQKFPVQKENFRCKLATGEHVIFIFSKEYTHEQGFCGYIQKVKVYSEESLDEVSIYESGYGSECRKFVME